MIAEAIILAGGAGSRLSGHADGMPKPLITVAGRPIVEHLIADLARQGIERFVLAVGYRAELVKAWAHKERKTYGQLIVSDAGEAVSAHSRVVAAGSMLESRETPVLVAYADTVADVDISALARSHQDSGKVCTATVHDLKCNYGVVTLEPDGAVRSFEEKPVITTIQVNIGYLAIALDAWSMMSNYSRLESGFLAGLARDKLLSAHRHRGYWKSIDTLADLESANRDAEEGAGPWIKARY